MWSLMLKGTLKGLFVLWKDYCVQLIKWIRDDLKTIQFLITIHAK